MSRIAFTVLLAWMLSSADIGAQPSSRPSRDSDILATVRIAVAVKAGGTQLPAGAYDVRLTPERPAPRPGQSRDAQQWVEFVMDGRVVAREVAEVLLDDDLPSVGASSSPVRSGTRVEMLKGGEFLRISVKRDRERYLIHLPVMH